MTTQRRLSSTTFALLAGFACFTWAFIAWLAVIPNQDMLADAVQVQSLFNDPRLVLSFPGQKHAGTIEYPLQILAEAVAPGNFYVHTFPRVIFAFLTGFFTAKLFLRLFPTAKHWSFLTAIFIGPAIIHGLSGPEGNEVGVWWLVGNYDTSWLLVVIGTLFFSTGIARDSRWLTLLSGVVIGLGFFAHPNVILLIIPLGTLALLVLRPSIGKLLLLASGLLLGIIPSLVSYFFYSGNNTWDPSRIPFFVRDFYLNALGLNGIPDYISVVLPYAFGLPSSQNYISGSAQSTLTWILAIASISTALIGWIYYARQWRWPSDIVVIATSWSAAILGIMLFVTFVDTVWFYATSLSILFWITLGILPTAVSPKWLAISITVALLILEGFSMVTHNWRFYSNLPAKIEAKRDYQSDIKAEADALQREGVQIIYGSYLDVIPIAYASSFDIRPLSVRYNRFPLNQGEENLIYKVAIVSEPRDEWGKEGLAIVTNDCSPYGLIEEKNREFLIFNCQGQAIDANK